MMGWGGGAFHVLFGPVPVLSKQVLIPERVCVPVLAQPRGLLCVPGSPYYDNVRPLSYPDSDAVIICFDISRPETLDSVLKKVGTA